jgi:uncharacterized protein YndB with AHSA1/START domain
MNVNHETQVEIPPVTKSIDVNLPVDAAFRLFTEGLGTWWPLRTHSVGEARAATCKLEGRMGGRLYEILEDGVEVDWGTILSWEPPNRLVFSWHPGYNSDQAQEVEVTFEPYAAGSRLYLIHRGWEKRSAEHPEVRDGYDSGWDIVLERYLSQAEALRTQDR